MKRTAMAASVLLAAACGRPAHSLQVSAPVSIQKRSCTIEVGAITDADGIDHGLALRDRLVRSGPCETVVMSGVGEPSRADIRVHGDVESSFEQGPEMTGVGTAGLVLTTLGLSVGFGTGVTYAAMTANDGDAELAGTFANIALGGAAVMVIGIVMWIGGDVGVGGETDGTITATGSFTSRDGRAQPWTFTNHVWLEQEDLPSDADQYSAAYQLGLDPVFTSIVGDLNASPTLGGDR